MSDNEKLTEALLNFCNALESACVDLKRQLADTRPPPTAPHMPSPQAVREETFTILKWESQHGDRLGDYEIAYKKNNLPENWTQAHSILVQSNSTIQSSYKGQGYQHRYWLYGEDKIYRKKV